jgi:methyl-accepting chemotaxis protein
MRCENLAGCPFYNNKMSTDSGLGKLYKEKYCESNKNKCARYMVAKTIGKEYVPIDLYPNMHKRAKKIISEHKK